MSQNSKISVIIPVYNGEKYLRKTVQSIQASTHQNLEIILINDGSSDSSNKICLELSDFDSRIRVISQENQGIAAARNKGLQYATGEWIALCDQDDFVDKLMYETMLKRAENDNSDLAICGMGKLIGKDFEKFEVFNENTVELLERNEVIEKAMYSIMFEGYRITEERKISTTEEIKIRSWIWRCLINKRLLDTYNINFKQFINFEDDRTFLLEILSVSQRVSLIKECFYFWRVNLESESYRKKYIKNIKEKMYQYSTYEREIFNHTPIKKKVLDKYFRIENCNNYVQIIENEYNDSTKNLKEKIKYLKENIYDSNFRESIEERKNLKNNVFKKRGVLFFLNYKCVVLAYLFDIVYLQFKRKALKYRSWTVLESFIGKNAK